MRVSWNYLLMKTSKKLVFFGNEKLATGISRPDPVIRKALENAGFEIEQHVTGKLLELRPHEAKLAVLAAYGHIIPQPVLDEFPLGIINVHPSLLPLYRGPTPIETAILDGATKTGVSIMRLTAGMDEGPVYKQKTVNLKGDETKEDLAKRLQRLGSELLIDVLAGIADGTLRPREQPHPVRATYSKLLTKQDGFIDWSKPAQMLEREVRAYLGWPRSQAKIYGHEVIVTKARVASSNDDGSLVMPAKDSYLEILELIAPSGRTMSGADFIRGYKRS
jgi:methionyl-tRNA formyltransferase